MKYLFSAQFSNDEFFHQTHEDKSLIVPTRSAFYDVLQRQNDVVKFELYHSEDKENYIVVNLTNGSFRINGLDVLLHDQEKEKIEKFRLIYFRKVEADLFMDGSSSEPRIVSFNVGWQGTNKNGENIKHIFSVS